MFFIEDLLQELAKETQLIQYRSRQVRVLIDTSWQQQFLDSIKMQLDSGRALTVKQAATGIRMIGSMIDLLVAKGMHKSEIRESLKNPRYHQIPVEPVDYPNQVRWIGSSQLVFRFRFNKDIINSIKELKTDSVVRQNPKWFSDYKIWCVSVDTINVSKVIAIISRYSFEFDDDVALFLTEVSNSKQTLSKALIDENIRLEIRNDPLMSMIFRSLMEIGLMDV
jgi:hypothetical protein